MSSMNHWNSDGKFGFDGPSSGSDTATAPVPGFPAVSTVQPAPNALRALADPKGSAIFWIAAAAVLSLGLVHGKVALNNSLRVGKGK